MLAGVMSLADPCWLGAPESLGGGVSDNSHCIGMKWAGFDRCQVLLFTPSSGLNRLWSWVMALLGAGVT